MTQFTFTTDTDIGDIIVVATIEAREITIQTVTLNGFPLVFDATAINYGTTEAPRWVTIEEIAIERAQDHAAANGLWGPEPEESYKVERPYYSYGR